MDDKCLHPGLCKALASLAHTETLCVGDYRLPMGPGAKKIELAWKRGHPRWLEVCGLVAANLPVEKILLAEELRTQNPAMHQAFLARFAATPVEYIPHGAFKQQAAAAKVAVRTGEFSSFCNCIFVTGVEF